MENIVCYVNPDKRRQKLEVASGSNLAVFQMGSEWDASSSENNLDEEVRGDDESCKPFVK
jgi:hypothetical protein